MRDPSTAVTLAEVQRDRLRAYITRLGPTPWWYWPVEGVALGGMFGVRYVASTAASLLLVVPFVGVTGLANKARMARHGAVPRFRGMPAPLRGVIVIQSVMTGLLVGGATAVAELLDEPVLQFVSFVALTAVGISVGGWHFERRYRAEAQRLADEAGIKT